MQYAGSILIGSTMQVHTTPLSEWNTMLISLHWPGGLTLTEKEERLNWLLQESW